MSGFKDAVKQEIMKEITPKRTADVAMAGAHRGADAVNSAIKKKILKKKLGNMAKVVVPAAGVGAAGTAFMQHQDAKYSHKQAHEYDYDMYKIAEGEDININETKQGANDTKNAFKDKIKGMAGKVGDGLSGVKAKAGKAMGTVGDIAKKSGKVVGKEAKLGYNVAKGVGALYVGKKILDGGLDLAAHGGQSFGKMHEGMESVRRTAAKKALRDKIMKNSGKIGAGAAILGAGGLALNAMKSHNKHQQQDKMIDAINNNTKARLAQAKSGQNN